MGIRNHRILFIPESKYLYFFTSELRSTHTMTYNHKLLGAIEKPVSNVYEHSAFYTLLFGMSIEDFITFVLPKLDKQHSIFALNNITIADLDKSKLLDYFDIQPLIN